MLWEKKEIHILIKGSIYQEDITIINIYTRLTPEVQNRWNKILTELKGEMDNSTIIAGDFILNFQ